MSVRAWMKRTVGRTLVYGLPAWSVVPLSVLSMVGIVLGVWVGDVELIGLASLVQIAVVHRAHVPRDAEHQAEMEREGWL